MLVARARTMLFFPAKSHINVVLPNYIKLLLRIEISTLAQDRTAELDSTTVEIESSVETTIDPVH